MASVINDGKGRRRIQFFDKSGERRSIRLGVMSKDLARSFSSRVEELVSFSITSRPVTPDIIHWLNGLDNSLHERLAKVGLVEARNGSTLQQFLNEFYDLNRSKRPNTTKNYKQVGAKLVEYFGKDKKLPAITPKDADQFREWLATNQKLAFATVSKYIVIVRQIFKVAKRWRVVHENVFDDVVAGSQVNAAKQRFIDSETARRVIDACPDAQWRLIFSLSRYGGLRCPSEHLTLRWCDIDWMDNRIVVQSPKTAHHEGRATRTIPLFPELKTALLDVFSEASDSPSEYVITRYRQANSNLRTQFLRILAKATIEPWPRLFHNLRATRQTELEDRFPSHVVCAWLGNSRVVAQKHYLQVTPEHFTAALSPVQKAAQQTVARPRTESPVHDDNVDLRSDATGCDSVRNDQRSLQESNALRNGLEKHSKVDGDVQNAAQILSDPALLDALSRMPKEKAEAIIRAIRGQY